MVRVAAYMYPLDFFCSCAIVSVRHLICRPVSDPVRPPFLVRVIVFGPSPPPHPTALRPSSLQRCALRSA